MKSINMYLKEHEKFKQYPFGYRFKDHAPNVVCADGFSMSVQASSTHWCSPRSDYGPYEAVEVGYPSKPEPLLDQYSDGNVYSFVPVEVIDQIIAKHGGWKE